ncbi:MAG: TRAP transporter small permease subunit [Alphaproteobacteria bacterium]
MPQGLITRYASAFSRFLGKIAMLSNAVGTLTVLALVIIMNIDVVARGLFNAPFRGVIEVVIFSMILIVFLQLPDVVRVNRLTRSDGLLTVIGASRPRLGRALTRTVDAIACIFMAIATYATWPEFIDTIQSCHYFTPPEFGPAFTGDLFTDLRAATARCEYFGTPGIFTAPWWPARLVISASTGLCSLLFLFKVLLGGRQPELVHMRDNAGQTT